MSLTRERQQLVVDFMPAAEAFVLRTYRPSNPEARENLMSAAYEGLVRAATAYEDRGHNFWSYARTWVFKMCNEMIMKDHTIRPPWEQIKRGHVEHEKDVVPLVESEEALGRSVLSVFGQEESGYDEVEDALMSEWVAKVVGSYSTETYDAWVRYKEAGRLPEDEDRRACVLLLDDELKEGLQ